MLRSALRELKEHAPFTLSGAIVGILLAFLLRKLPESSLINLFYVFHPAHVFVSAFVTTSMYKLNKKNTNLFKIFLVGFLGSIGVATLSDSILPFLGETMLHMPNTEMHLGFLEKWYIVNPIAILGIIFANIKSSTKFPHSVHVFLSTTASLLHIVMSLGLVLISFQLFFEITLILFLSVWLPCCFSDIIFPLLFVSDKKTSD